MQLKTFQMFRSILLFACVGILLSGTGTGAAKATRRVPAAGIATSSTPANNFNLADYGAAGDGITDDGPALQRAIDAVAAAGGGTVIVPAGRYAILTPVTKDFTNLASTVTIQGIESSTPVPSPTANGDELTRGLNLVSEFFPRTGSQPALIIAGLKTFLIKDIAFVGTPGASTDAVITLGLHGIDSATVRHCEFYGLITQLGAAVVYAVRTGLTIEQSVFLGCTADSGLYSPVVDNLEWKGITVADTVFADYGQRPELFGKTGYGAPISWINIGNAAALTSEAPRREVVIRNVFLDEGGFYGISALPDRYQQPSAPIDLVYVTGLFMNVSNLGGSTGHYFTQVRRVLIESSHYGWSQNTDAAIDLVDVENAILDEVECVDEADRIRADSSSGKVTVINSVYTHLASLAQTTTVISGASAPNDPVKYVRQRFENALGREPDAAAHFYWSDPILQCGGNAQCVAARRAELAAYLATSPQPNFAITGRVTDEAGTSLPNVTVALTGSQSVTTQTGADGRYRFSGLPTSGVYTVTASKTHYTATEPQTITTPSGDRVADFTATFNHHSIDGRVVNVDNAGVQGVTVVLSGAQSGSTTTDANGDFFFLDLPAGGTYTVTPALVHHTVSPANKTFDDLSANQYADFLFTHNSYSISGRVTNSSGGTLAGTIVTLSGSHSTATTIDADGNFNFIDLPAGGNYAVVPSKPHYTFAPQSLSVSSLSENKVSDFAGTLNRHSISGRVMDGSNAVAGVTVTLTGTQGATSTTDSGGAYTFANLPAGGTYTVSASKQHYTFSDTPVSFSDLDSDKVADFAAKLNRHKLSGRLTNTVSAPLSGITMVLTGAQGKTATTDSDGNYSFNDLPAGGNYTVAPSDPRYWFTPGPTSVGNLGSDNSINFTGTLLSFIISGRVMAGTTGLDGVTMTLTGSDSALVTTNASGEYSFSVLATGNYTVTATKQNHSFAPASRSFENLSAAQTANFAATHTISGRVAPGGTGLGNVTVTLSGAQSAQVVTDATGAYSFTLPAAGNYTVTPTKSNYTFDPASVSFNNLGGNQVADFGATLVRIVEFSAAAFSAAESEGIAQLTVARTGDTSGEAEVTYSASSGTATQGKDFSTVIGTLRFAPGETSKAVSIFITYDGFTENNETVMLHLTGPVGATLGVRSTATLTINDSPAAIPNPIDATEFFVRQHYRDFLGREPDAAGLNFWSSQITACGSDAQCIEEKRINVSAAFFLSIEFQETGYFVHRLYKASYARAARRVEEFILDAHEIGDGVIVGTAGWEQLLAAKRLAFVRKFVERPEFAARYAAAMTPAEFVAALNANAGLSLTSAEAAAAAAEFGGAANTADAAARARVLRLVVENETFSKRETSPAFVLMQYFGYLQRNPDDAPDQNLAGYNFWLTKLNQFNGDYRSAEMVKAFIASIEYRERFGR